MKKYIFGAVMFLASLMALPAFAQTADDYGTAATGTYCPVLSITMQRGARDVSYRGQVSELQKFISDYYDINPEKIVTGFFGRLTQEYVQQFQREQKLPTFGITGSMTRAAIAKVCGGISTNQSSTNTQNNVLNTNATSNTQTSSSLQNVSVQDFITGHNIAAADRINLVFVGINFASLDEFKTAITRELGWSGTPDKNGDFGPFAIEPLRSNKNKFNVWYDPTMITGATTVDDINEQIVQISNSKFNGNGTIAKLLPYTVPVYLNKLQTHADGTDTRIVHHADGYGITLSNNSFSSLAKSELHPRTVLITIAGLPHEPSTLAHEFGHSIFGLEDEKTHDEFDLPGVVPRSRAPNCVATMADAQALWGDMVGQVDPFYTEWKQITTRQPSAHMDEGMKVGYYYGKCYGDTNGKNVIRPTKYSIMNENTQTVAFGSVNRRQIETVLGFFSGSTAPIIATPHITRISSSIGTTGPSVTINGSGFTPTDNTLYIDGYSSTASYLWTIGTYPAVSNGNSIIFTLPSYQSPVCGLGGSLLMGCPAPSPIDPGTHTLTVKNANGVSNEASVMISTCAPGSAWNGSSCVAPIADATITVDGTAISNNAIITIPAGVSKTLVWNSNVGTTCGLNGKRWGSAVPSSGSMQLSGASADSYTFNCKGMNSFNFTVVADTVAITSVPTITAPTVTSITQTTAMLGASVVSLGNPAAVDGRGICWGTTPSPTNCAYPMWQEKQQLGAFAQLITSLTPGITYYYRGYATNVTGRGYSSDSTFTTLPCAPGSAWNGSSCVAPIADATITVDGTAISNNAIITIPAGVSKTLVWNSNVGTTCGLNGKRWGSAVPSSGSMQLSGASADSYTFNCKGMNSFNFTVVADTVAITSVPTITAPTVTSITQTTAMLGASVVSLGNPAAVDGRGICWGTTPSPTNCAYPMWQEKQQLGAFAQLITSLTPGITYYYRGYATNVTGRGYSSDSTFTTLPCAPGSAWNGSSCVGVPAPTPTPEPTPTPTQAPVITADSTAIPNGGTVTIPTRGSVTLRFKDGCTFRPGLLSSSGTYDSLSKMHSWSINEQSVGSYTIDCSGMDPLNFTIVIAPPMAFGNSANQTASVLGAFNSVTSSNSPQSQGTNNFHYVWNRYLQIGSAYPDDIIALQTALAREGVYTGEKTGGFYNQTFVAVKSFQQKYGIEATGFVGSATRSKLNALYSE